MCQTFFIVDVCSHMQQVAIIFLLYDTAGPSIHSALLFLLLCPKMGATQPTSKVMQTFCVDTSPLILCLCLVPPTLFAVFV